LTAGDSVVVVPVLRMRSDYRDALLWQRWHSWSIYAILGVGAAWGIFRYHEYPLQLLVFFAIVGIGVGVSSSVVLAWSASRMLAAHAANGVSTYTFSAEGYEYRNDVSSSSGSWSALKSIVETGRSYLLVYPNSSVLIIPKSCVPADKVEQLRELLVRALPGRVKLRR
jgi:YcxB-like protein